MRRLVAAGVLLAALTTCGCGPKLVIVRGKVVENDQPLKLTDDDDPQMKFMWEELDGPKVAMAFIKKPDATFEFQGPIGRGVPPGPFSVSVTVGKRPIPISQGVKPDKETIAKMSGGYGADRYNEKFVKTPLNMDVLSDKSVQYFLVDLTKGTITPMSSE
jgi:hypothetical protein